MREGRHNYTKGRKGYIQGIFIGKGLCNKFEPPLSDHPKCQAKVVAYERSDDRGSYFRDISLW